MLTAIQPDFRPLETRIEQAHGLEKPSVLGSDVRHVTPFAERLQEFIKDVDGMQRSASEIAEAYANGQQNDLHGTMIATAQADITLRLMANIRNRAIEAYREIMRMGA